MASASDLRAAIAALEAQLPRVYGETLKRYRSRLAVLKRQLRAQRNPAETRVKLNRWIRGGGFRLRRAGGRLVVDVRRTRKVRV